MRLDTILEDLDVVALHGDPTATDISGVVHDSREVVAGSLFCCVRGLVRDGHDYAPDAVARGAAALICERKLPVELPQVQVADVRRQMGRAAAAFHGHPSRALTVCGVTGTNGKTTVTHLLGAILEAHGWSTRVLGTLSGPRTTPEATDLQRTLAEMRDTGTRAVAMEVSSHALALHRVEATWFSVAVFTNLSRDHLELHGSMEAYFQAKARLFEPERAALGVVNLDDPHGRLLHEAATIPTVGFSLSDASGIDHAAGETRFTWERERVRLPLVGSFSVSNALAAATAARELGVPVSVIAAALSEAPTVPGRFEVVDEGQPFTVVVDYAHTPDGLERALEAARSTTTGGRRGGVTVVFGCGGDRDPGKRPVMGEIAARLADVVIVTTDNPRSEDPLQIIEQVRSGAPDATNVRIQPDRRSAIRDALHGARQGDVVLIAGKGHESVQIFPDRNIPFDDRSVAREELVALRNAREW